MARPKKEIQTERLCVTIPAAEVLLARASAAKAGVAWTDFVRQALASQIAVESTRPKPGPLAREAAILTPADRRAVHEHVSGKMLSGGIHLCQVSGCEARKVGGRWVEVS